MRQGVTIASEKFRPHSNVINIGPAVGKLAITVRRTGYRIFLPCHPEPDAKDLLYASEAIRKRPNRSAKADSLSRCSSE
jgi:hypothetical protein